MEGDTNTQRKGKGIELQPRDMDIMTGLFDSRVMTLAHIAAMYFDGKPEAAKKRVQRLKAGGWMAERPRRSTEPATHTLTAAGVTLLAEAGRLDSYSNIPATVLKKRTQVSDLTLLHELAVVDVRAAFAAALRDHPSLRLAEFTTWPLLSQFEIPRHLVDRRESGSVVVKPDGFLRIHETDRDGETYEHACFLELDRSSESQEILARKALCYGHYYRSGGFARRHHRPASEFAEFPFRVLFVLQSEERCRNTALRLLQNDPPTLTQVWLATYRAVREDPLGSIWRRAVDARVESIGTSRARSANDRITLPLIAVETSTPRECNDGAKLSQEAV